MSIFPLPVFEADADSHHRTSRSDEEIYASLQAPKTIVVKFGFMKQIGEFPYDGDSKPGCGTKLIARTTRGTELVEMLTTTCSNSGCGKSISRNEMLDYIENSGGRDYPFHQKGRILRVATVEDLNKQSSLDSLRKECVKFGKAQIAEMGLVMKLVDVEPILGGESIMFYYMAEERIDFRDLVQRLSSQFKTRIEMRQVGARDEARLVADYERCGQHCCCKNFLKVLKPVSMRAAKVQKATLDPLKISGRCGRLMCCLRYEDQTYKELKSNLPPRNKRVGTSEGPGVVIDSKILVQLVLVRLEHDFKEIAVPVEELMDPETCPKPGAAAKAREVEAEKDDVLRGLTAEQVLDRTTEEGRRDRASRRDRGGDRGGKRGKEPVKDPIKDPQAPTAQNKDQQGQERQGKEKRGRGRRNKHQQQDAFRKKSQAQEQREQTTGSADGAAPQDQLADGTSSSAGPIVPGTEGRQPRRKRRRRRRGGKGRGKGGGGAQGGGDGGGPSGGGGSPPAS